MQGEKPLLVELRGVSKWFGPTRSLAGVSFDVRAGEVHVLAGANGAGKTTLIRVLSGVFPDYEGEVLVAGARVALHQPADARRAGIATIHQELPLVGSLSIADNLALGEPGPLFGRVNRRSRAARARELLALVGAGADVDASAKVESLPLGLRQLVEIARALGRSARLVIFDEPSSALGAPDAERLFSLITALKSAGKGIIYISHRMDEIYRLADRITVLRDGALVCTRKARDLPAPALIRAMTGSDLASEGAFLEAPASAPLLQVSRLSLHEGRRKRLADVSFTLRTGEILGVAGLQGAGASELLYTLFGASSGKRSGAVELAGAPYEAKDPQAAIERGVVLLPSDRAQSVLPDLGLVENATLSSLHRFSRGGLVSRAAERQAAARIFERLALTRAADRRYARELSGGNRQRLALARCLLTEPRVLLLDDPTRGVDIAAKRDIHRLVRELAASGVGVLWAASELDELVELTSRVLVLSRGRVSALFERGEATASELLRAAMSSGDRAAGSPS